MRRMGFSYPPDGAMGYWPKDFVTVRSLKWGNRINPGEVIEIHGEHGCSLPPIPATVISITKRTKPCPDYLVREYGTSQKLVDIRLSIAATDKPE